MDQEQTISAVLLPIQPNYVREITRGVKLVEFRRRAFARRVDYVVIYETSPTQKIVGYFKAGDIHSGTPEEIWDRYHLVGGVPHQAFFNYFQGSELAVAIEISNLQLLVTPISLADLSQNLKAPQSYSYLEPGLFGKLVEAAA